MPELPEVETVKNIIEPLIKNKTISSIEIFYNNLIKSNIDDFKNNLLNQTFLNVTRYGKYLFLHLTNNLVLIVHLRMEGKFRYVENGNFRIKSTSLIFYFKDGTGLAFDDTRKFGIMYLSTEDKFKELEMIKKLGYEPFDVNSNNINYIYRKFNKKKPIKLLLLDQTILTGIGNIYADETLYLSKINPLTLGSELNKEDINQIIENSKKILRKAINLGGSTIHSFHPGVGIDGKFQESLLCYGKEGEKCPRCQTRFHKIFLNKRGTTFCPNCQINHELQKAIGITGPIGSGKSTALKYLEELGYLTFSADEMVHELYNETYIQNKISKILKFKFVYSDKNSRNYARKIMIKNPTLKTQVEDYIYPLLEDKMLDIIKNNENVVFEVPLLFKAHFEYMFKKIFVIFINKDKQTYNLNFRNHANDLNSIKINSDFNYNKDNKNIVIIENNGSLADFFEKIKENINKD